jgi:hypothetical protein
LIYNAIPFVFISGLPIDSVFANKDVAIEKIGVFDDNWRKTGHKRYNWDLVREVAIIRNNQETGHENGKH